MRGRRSGRTARSRGRRRRATAICLAVAIAALAWPAVSYGHALNAVGAAPWSVRTVDWMRDHGGGPLVDTAENFYYTLHAPDDQPPKLSALPTASRAGARRPDARQAPAITLPILAGRSALPAESQWQPLRPDAVGLPTTYTAYFRPDPHHRSVVVGVAWIRAAAVEAHLVAGTAQPGHGFSTTAAVPAGSAPDLVATFNSGWRFQDISGGFFLNGQAVVPLVPGRATAAIDTSGRMTVGQWGRDLLPGPQWVAARQNLDLIVAGGQLVPGLDLNRHGRWGTPKSQFQYTGRSALGVDKSGNLIYIAGDGLTLHTVAVALKEAGAVSGMELDIHRGMQAFASWIPVHGHLEPAKLLPTLLPRPDRYLEADQHDFFYLTLRRPSAGPH